MDSDPKDSSAAKCIQVHFLGKSFYPEYTHQCFEEETIFGYAPFPTDHTRLSSNNILNHPSYNNHIYAKEYLRLEVDLAPSCEKCKITVHTAPIMELQTSSTTMELSSSSMENLSLSGTKRKDMEGPSRLEIPQVLSRLKLCLPVDETTTSDTNDDVTNHFIQIPVGTKISEFTTIYGSFVVHLAHGNDDRVESYHNKVQKLALMFIENASPVDLRSNEGGEWNILYLYLKHGEHKYSLVGYMTLFNFFSPFKKPKSGVVLRICQALILPIYQRQGHGKRLMSCVFDLANGKYTNDNDKQIIHEIVEINVEDPCPAFVLLRNMVDYNNFTLNVTSEDPWIPIHYLQGFNMLTDADATNAACKAKITKTQMHISYEIYKLKMTLSLLSNMNDGPDKENIAKQYRLMVKKRLNQFHKEDIGACGSKEEKQMYLTKLYDDAYNHYLSILNRKY